MTDPDSVRLLFEATVRAFGRVDLVFNNAGTRRARPVPLEDLTVGGLAKGRRRQPDRPVPLQPRGLPSDEGPGPPRGGRIINNGSISAHVPRPDSAPYTATKHAITGLTRSRPALDGRKYDIACGQIDIGNAETEMTARMKAGVRQADGSLAPEPTMDVANVARAVVHMASLARSTPTSSS